MSGDDVRPLPTAESIGFDKGYEHARPRAFAALDGQMAGPRHSDLPKEGVKNPEGECQNPALFTGSPHADGVEEADGAGNSAGNGDLDPQGQQGGTLDDQPAKPSLPSRVRPLAGAAERSSQDRKPS